MHGGRVSGVQRVTPDVLAAMEEMNAVAPAHNPPYITAMRLLAEKLPRDPAGGGLRDRFPPHDPRPQPLLRRPLRVGREAALVRRYGFHGASHRYIATRTAELLGRNDLRIISCHLGGSSSLCAIRDGQSVATSMGISPQTGLPHNNRVGDFDPFALPVVMKQTGKSLDEVLAILANQSGLLGLSGVSGDMRDIDEAAATGNARAQAGPGRLRRRACGTTSAPTWSNSAAPTRSSSPAASARTPADFRAAVCREPGGVGHRARRRRPTQSAQGEATIHAANSRVQIWVMPTNEELIVARQAANNCLERLTHMFVAKVTGSLVWPRRRSPRWSGHKLLVVEPYRLDPKTAGQPGRPRAGRSSPSTRSAPAKASTCCITQGSSARLTPETKNLPDRHGDHRHRRHVHVDHACVYAKEGRR